MAREKQISQNILCAGRFRHICHSGQVRIGFALVREHRPSEIAKMIPRVPCRSESDNRVQHPTRLVAAHHHFRLVRPAGRTVTNAMESKDMAQFLSWRPSRRHLIRGAVGVGVFAAQSVGNSSRPRAAAAPQAGAVPAAGDILTRAIPKTNEILPAIGLGTFLTFDTIPGQPRENLHDVLQHYWNAGARLVDTSPLYGTAEITVGDFAISLGINQAIFVADKIWATGEFLTDESHALRSLDLSLGRLWRERIDLMQCHSLVNVDVIVPYLKAWKKEGRIRYAGVTHFENAYHEPLADWVERGDVDFVQVNYSIFNRAAERRVLRAAADHGIAVMTNMPFEKARLFRVVEGRQVPDFARQIGIDTWPQFFLKWVISNPTVTCALPSTSNPEHALENVAALRGQLPDPDTRERMARYIQDIPGFDRIAEMPWYPGKQYRGIIGRAQAELRARS
jgi:diketogulonate reductase-like aldo/keto reductase